jgi:hypothetical protein
VAAGAEESAPPDVRVVEIDPKAECHELQRQNPELLPDADEPAS